MTAPLAPMLTPAQAADELGVTTADLAAMRRAGTGPRHSRFGATVVRYSPAAVCEWRHHQQQRTEEPDPDGGILQTHTNRTHQGEPT